MPSFTGKVTSGVGHGPSWGWMDRLLCKNMNWHQIEVGTLNVCLDDYAAYTNIRSVEFLIPHTASPMAGWDCYFQRCSITANGKTVNAVIATTGDNYWGKQRGAIEVRAEIKLRTALGVNDGSTVTIMIA